MALNDEEYLSLMCSPPGQGTRASNDMDLAVQLTDCSPRSPIGPSEFYQQYVQAIQQTSAYTYPPARSPIG